VVLEKKEKKIFKVFPSVAMATRVLHEMEALGEHLRNIYAKLDHFPVSGQARS